MKSWIAVLVCLLINGMAVRRAFAQTSTHVHSTSGYLGVGVVEIDAERARTLKLRDEHGVVVMNVGADTPAAKAGLKESDVILEFNGQRVEGVEQFMRMVRETPAGRKVSLQVSRNGNIQVIGPTLTARANSSRVERFEVHGPDMPDLPWNEMSPVPLPPLPPSEVEMPELPEIPRVEVFWPQSSVGIEAVTLNGQLAEYFGVKEGVLVRSVGHNSPAEKAGIKAGDVVTRVGGSVVKTPQDVSREVRGHRAEKAPVAITVMRNHKEMDFSIKPAENWQSAAHASQN